jgi:hypothetical protein
MNNDSRSRSPLSSDELLRPILGERHPGTFSQQSGMLNVTTLNQDLTNGRLGEPALPDENKAGLGLRPDRKDASHRDATTVRKL